MVDLMSRTPLQGLTPVTIGTVTVAELDPGRLTTIAPYRGKAKQASDVLKQAHGLGLPDPNSSTAKGAARAIWFGREMAMLMGPAPDLALADHAALTDQSDAWAVVTLTGPDSARVLSRLCPLDLRESVFEVGHTARTELQHMMASITRLEEDCFQIMVFRAFGKTLLHDLTSAMQGVAARAQA